MIKIVLKEIENVRLSFQKGILDYEWVLAECLSVFLNGCEQYKKFSNKIFTSETAVWLRYNKVESYSGTLLACAAHPIAQGFERKFHQCRIVSGLDSAFKRIHCFS